MKVIMIVIAAIATVWGLFEVVEVLTILISVSKGGRDYDETRSSGSRRHPGLRASVPERRAFISPRGVLSRHPVSAAALIEGREPKLNACPSIH
jgi:hypothetical protein